MAADIPRLRAGGVGGQFWSVYVPATLRMTCKLGARYMTLTHTKNTGWADAAGDKPEHHGLTRFGEKVVIEMNRRGMLMDLPHVLDDTMRSIS